MTIYTLVVNGDCPAIGADTDVYLQREGILSFAGEVDSVLFEGNALAQLEEQAASIKTLCDALDEAAILITKGCSAADEHWYTSKYRKLAAQFNHNNN